MKKYSTPGISQIIPEDPVFAGRVKQCLDRTIAANMEKIISTGRLEAFKLNWKEGNGEAPHIYWDSDTAKVLEGMAYALALRPDPELEKSYDEWVDLIVSAQQPDGYLNTHFTVTEQDKRWRTLMYSHELYCAGHLIEAAAAGYECLGKRKLLDCICRYVDYIDSIFGAEPGKRRAWSGHQEIELALMRLHKITGNERHRALAAYFVNDRGVEPNIFVEEVNAKISPPPLGKMDMSYFQAHVPVREQHEAIGHAVRAVYLYAGMADVAESCNDSELLDACAELFDSIVKKRMYIHGGIGSTFLGERLTIDYDLSNSSIMYAESCAAMGLVQFARRMFNITGEDKYLDIMEQALYNGVLSGISLQGDTFFYDNYLEVDDCLMLYNVGSKVRQPWFFCSCCPTSYARFIPQLGSFLWSAGKDSIHMNIPAACSGSLTLADGRTLGVKVRGNYPYNGSINIELCTAGTYKVELRIPAWCRKYSVKINGQACANVIERNWCAGDIIELELDMPITMNRSNFKVCGNAGKVVIKRGPVIYALEQTDNQYPVRELKIKTSSPMSFTEVPGLPENTPAITGKAVREYFCNDDLYTDAEPMREETTFTAIPYALWQNRGETSAMHVWLREES